MNAGPHDHAPPAEAPPAGPDPAGAVVQTHNLTKQWGATVALLEVTTRIGRGVTGLLGSNGAGKTTLLKLILGLSRPTDGSITVLDLDPQKAGPEVRARLGYAPEDDVLPEDMRAHDLVRHMAEIHGIPRRVATGRASDALYLVGLGEERFRPIGTMSTGQRQRVKLAQAVAHDPALVLLDEPTNGLDPMQRSQMLDLIRHVGHETGLDVILSSHLLGEVERVCDGVVVLDAGRLVTSGSLTDIQQESDELLLDVDADATALSKALRAKGLKVSVQGYHLTVGLNGDATYDAVRDALASTGTPLRRMRRRTASLEDIFFHTPGDAS